MDGYGTERSAVLTGLGLPFEQRHAGKEIKYTEPHQ